MSPFNEPAPDPERDGVPRDPARRGAGGRHPPGRAQLRDLGLDPTLAHLADDGWRLDRLPTTSVALAFGVALFTTLVTLGAVAATPLVVTAALGVSLAVAALGAGDVPAARVTLQGARVVLVGWTLLCACTGT
jgi:hypothetical protein